MTAMVSRGGVFTLIAVICRASSLCEDEADAKGWLFLNKYAAVGKKPDATGAGKINGGTSFLVD